MTNSGTNTLNAQFICPTCGLLWNEDTPCAGTDNEDATAATEQAHAGRSDDLVDR